MNKTKRPLSNNEIGILFLLGALLGGAIFRLWPAYRVNFPINDGGLFYNMIEAIKGNGMRLPTHVEYNGLQIPFAYPPLAFYFSAGISNAFHIPTLELEIWLPALFTILVLPAFYYLASVLFKSPIKAGVATFLLAFLPRALGWMIMGGGITRAPGQLLYVLAVSQYYLLYKTGKNKYLPSSILVSILICLTHPEATIHTIGTALLFWWFLGRNPTGIKNSAIVLAGTLIGTSPWWLLTLSRFGVAPYLAASETGLHTPAVLFQFFASFTGETFMAPISLLAVFGFFIQVARRDFLLPAWLILPFVLEPRNAPNIAIFALALLAASALINFVLPWLGKIANPAYERAFQTRIEKSFILYLTMVLLLNMMRVAWSQSGQVLTEDARAAMYWVENNTDPNARFLVISGDTNSFADLTNEWFPVIAHRRSQTTLQGYEWNTDVSFSKIYEDISRIQTCAKGDNPLKCIDEVVAANPNVEFQYLYLERDTGAAGNLIVDIETSRRYQRIFTNHAAVIYEKAH